MSSPLPVPFSFQDEIYNCGPHNLRLVLNFFGTEIEESKLREYAQTTVEEGTKCEMLSRAARLAGFFTYESFSGTIEDLRHYLNLGYPVIVYLFGATWPHHGYGDVDRAHFMTVTSVQDTYVTLHDTDEDPDPFSGGPHIHMETQKFIAFWSADEGRRDKKWFLVVAPQKLNENFAEPLS